MRARVRFPRSAIRHDRPIFHGIFIRGGNTAAENLSATLVGEHYPRPLGECSGAFIDFAVPNTVAIMLDGGHLRAHARRAQRDYNPDFIEQIARACAVRSETIHRVLYYDCAPFSGKVTLPVSGVTKQYTGADHWLHELARKELFAVRRGELKFRGFVPRKIPIKPPQGQLTDEDFRARFEQKGVDMRIGLDMAVFASNRAVDLIALATNDTDCIPAMKHARIAGLQVALVVVPDCKPAPALLSHADFCRHINWPVQGAMQRQDST